MLIYDKQITFREVPTEISFSLFVAGCPYHCKGCSWENINITPKEYSLTDFEYDLAAYLNKCSCITFLGGEWCDDLENYFLLCKKYKYKICLYTGIETFDDFKCKYENLLHYIDYLKVGHYNEEAGALYKATTNQRFYVLNNGNIIDEVKFYEL